MRFRSLAATERHWGGRASLSLGSNRRLPAKGRDALAHPGRNTNHAFTLMELIVSSSLMAMILVSSYVCLNAGMHGRRLVQQRS